MEIGPAGQRPGELVVISDESTSEENPKRLWVTFDPLTEDSSIPRIDIDVDGGENAEGWSAYRISKREIEVHLGFAYPIYYKVWVTSHTDTGDAVSKILLYEFGAWRYTVAVDKISTYDESNELSDADEVQIASLCTADLNLYAHISDEYSSMDAGDTTYVHTYDKFLHSGTGVPIEVKQWLALSVDLYEIDSNPLGTSGKWSAADGIASLAEMAGKTNTGVGVVAAAVLLVLSEAAALWIENDDGNFLGKQERVWSPVELLQRMVPGQNYFLEDLPFKNSDDEGNHTITLKISKY